ncbi:MAG: CHAT domain-containing protein [Spirulina sp.]
MLIKPCYLSQFSRTIAIAFLFVLGGISSTPAQNTPTRFRDWCSRLDSFPPETQNTIEKLLEQAGTNDCKLAEDILSAMPQIALAGQEIRDLRPLASFTNLTALSLNHNQIEDVSPLANLNNLTFLILGFNQIKDVAPLANLTNLTWLDLTQNQVTDIQSLAPLTQLRSLSALDNPIAQKVCPIQPTTTCTFSDDSGDVLANAEDLYERGKFKEAIAAFTEALETYQKASDRVREGHVLNRLGDSHRRLAQYPQALEFYEQALQRWQESADLLRFSTTLISLADIYERLGQYDRAKEHLDRAISKLSQQKENSNLITEGGIYALPIQEARLLENRARIEHKLAQNNRALSTAREALKIYDKMIFLLEISEAEDYSEIIHGKRSLLELIGKISIDRGQPRKGLDSLESALTFAKEIGDRAGEAQTLNQFGEAYRALGNPQKAREFYENAAIGLREVGDRAGEATALTNLGATLLELERDEEASRHLLDAVKIWEKLRPGLSDANKVSLFEIQAQTYQHLQKALVKRDRVEEALEIAERGRARAFVELLASRTQGEVTAIDSPNIQEIRAIAKTQNATLVQYSLIGEQIYIWVIQPNGAIDLRISEPEPPKDRKREKVIFNRLVSETRSALFSRSPRRTLAKLRQFHDLLIEPIATLLPTDPEDRVIFIPQGSLFLMPFAALQDEDGQYLIEKHTLSVAPSIQVLDLTRQRQAQIRERVGSPLIVGNPTMPGIAANLGEPPHPLAPLPGAETEARAIADLLSAKALIGDAASENAIARSLPEAKIVHLATHGLLDELDYLGLGIPGAIALAPDDRPKSDGLLTSNENFDLNLAAELVVLSACNTGRGKITGDGVIGLSRSFIAAGVPSIIVSLWAVPDAPTADLMREFYRRLQENPDKAKALREAMLNAIEQHPQPRDWAAFVLIGEG